MSNLIKGMLNELLVNKGKDIDKVILENVDTITTFDPRILQSNCLTSLFMLDVDKNPKEGFIRYCDDQEGYSDKNKRAKILTDALELQHDFHDKGFKSRNAENTTIDKFIAAIASDQAGFKAKYGNTLFVKALKDVSKQAPKAHFAVQLLSAITRAKLQAKDSADFEKLAEIENACKPFVYLALKENNPFKKQMDVQRALLDTFSGEQRYQAAEYFRCLSIHNIIKTKLANESQLSTNVSDPNDNNSLFYIDLEGFQRALINPDDSEVSTEGQTVNADGFVMQSGEKITDIIKKCAIIDDNLQPTRNSKYIQKVLMMINDKVNEFNGQTKRSKKSIQSKENFLQSAIAFLILLDVEGVRDDFDFIGVTIANPVSDILSMMKGSKELDTLIMNGYKIANRIARAELGESLNDRYFKYITAGEAQTEANTTTANAPSNTPAEVGDGAIDENIPAGTTTTTDNNDDDKKNGNGSRNKPPRRSSAGTSVVKKSTNKIKANVEFYRNITKALVAALSKAQAELKQLEEKKLAYDEAKAAGQKAKKLTKIQTEKLANLQERFGSADALSATIDDLKAMNSDMVFLADTMIKALRKGEELSLDNIKQSMFLSEEQYQKNAERIDSYTDYYKFIKAFDNSRKVTMADIYTYRDTHKDSTLSKFLVHLPAQRARQNVPQAQAAQTQVTDEAGVEEQHVDDPESHN